MVELAASDVQTTEVFDWQGIHLLHFMGSSCSQKIRIFLALKGIPWEGHHVDLSQNENYTEWFMGINPRGLVPVLVDDGNVIIESNDILEHLEARFPEPTLIPTDKTAESHALLEAEDDLHLDLRALTMRYVFPTERVMRSDEDLAKYEKFGTGKVAGTDDAHKAVELAFFRNMQEHGGITDLQVRDSVARFKAAYDGLDDRLGTTPYLLGENLSLIDIAWYIYSYRLTNAGYPLHRLHENVGKWFDGLHAREEFSREVLEPPPLLAMRSDMHAKQEAEGSSLVQVTGV